MLIRITMTIDDTLWPKLHLTGERVGAQGDRVAFSTKQQYDLAYGAFENTLHNVLRPAVDEILKRRGK